MALTCFVVILLFLNLISASNNHLTVRDESRLLLVQGDKIVLLNANNLKQRQIITDQCKSAVAVNYFYRENTIFFTDSDGKNDKKAGKRISRVNILNGRVDKIIDLDLKAPDGLAVDWIGRKLYWTDSEEQRIEVAELDGRNRKVLFWQNLDRPRAIVVDPLRGYLYWTDWGENTKIEKAGMHGGNRRKIVDKNLKWPNGLTLDYELSRLYWVDAHIREIASCDLEGGDIRIHYQMPKNPLSYGHPFAMTVLHQNLYFSDWDTHAVYSIEKQNSTKPRKVVVSRDPHGNNQHMYGAMDIKGYDPNLQPMPSSRRPHPCQVNNGNCSNLCLLKPTPPYYACACPTGIRYNNRTRSCSEWPQRLLILARGNSLFTISLDEHDYTLQTMRVKSHTPLVVDYDPIETMVYWADSKSKRVKNIQRAKLGGGNQEEIIGADVSSPDGLAVDWIGRNLYWTDTNANRIWISRLDGSALRVLLWKDLDEPRAIAVDPIHGYLFWSDWGHHPKIERSLLDGSNRTVIESNKTHVIWPNGLAIDYERKHLYYSDARLDNIQRCNLDGSNRTVIARKYSPHIFGFSLLDDFLYWTDWQSRSVGRIDIHGRNQKYVLEGKSGLMGLKAVNRLSWIRAPNNDCGRDRGQCSHLCLFYPFPIPRRLCACPIDHELLPDGVTCHKPDAYIIYSQRSDLHRLSATGAMVEDPLDVLPLTGITNAGPIAFDYRTQRLFWIDLEKNGVYQALLNGSHWSVVTERGVDKPRCLAVDWLHRNLYYGHAKPRARIEMVSIRLASSGKLGRSTQKRVLIYKDLNDPTALALDPIGGYMYWADSMRNLKVKVERAFLDGSRREHLFTHSGHISDMTIDLSERYQKLFWINRHQIVSSDLHGRNQTRIFSRPGWNISGLDVYGPYVYFTEISSKTIYRIRKAGGAAVDLTPLHNGAVAPADLLVHVEVRQRGTCRCCQGECHHFCLPRRHAPPHRADALAKCGCATHYSLLADKRTCQPPDAYILAVTHKGQVIRYVPNATSGQEPSDVILSIPGVQNVRSFAVVPEDNYMFYIDSETETIKRVNMMSERVVDLVPNQRLPSSVNPNIKRNRLSSSKLDRGQKAQASSFSHVLSPYELAYDPINRFLYWSDLRNHVINVTSTNGDKKGVVVNLGSRTPRSITIDPQRGELYWVSTNENGSEPRIERAELDGKNHIVIVADNIERPENLLVHEHYLYWIDSGTEFLERWDIKNGIRKGLLHGLRTTLGSPAGLVVLEGYLYWYSNGMLLRVFANSAENAFVDRHPLDGYDEVVDIAAVGPVPAGQTEVARKARAFCRCLYFCVPVMAARAKRPFRCGCPVGLQLSGQTSCEPMVTCRRDQFLCGKSRRCIPRVWLCDGASDCDNNLDEQNCPLCEGAGKYLCSDGTCLPGRKRCDGRLDCDSDEACCSPRFFQCDDRHRTCLPADKRCDGRSDCEGGSDEADCQRAARPGAGGGMGQETDASSRTTYTVAVVIAVLAVVLTCGIAGYTCTRRRRQLQAANQPYVMHTDQLDIMLVPKGPLFSGAPSMGDSDGRPGGSSHSRLGPSGSCPSSAPTGTLLPAGAASFACAGAGSAGALMGAAGGSGSYEGKRRGSARSHPTPPDIISFYERDRLTGASRSDTDAPDYAPCPLNPPPSPITDVGARGRTRAAKSGRARKRRHRSGGAAGGGSGSRHHHHHRRYHNVRLVIYTDAPPPTPRTCLSSAEDPGSNSPQSSRRSFAYNRPFPPPPSPENSSD